jgi:hypothetical protein
LRNNEKKKYMTRKLRKVPAEFAPEERFELEPTQPHRRAVEDKFADLKSSLLGDVAAQTQRIAVREALQLAANEAAGLAWNTGYPLLVFPTLFAEIAAKVRQHANRQEKIKARSEILLAEAV